MTLESELQMAIFLKDINYHSQGLTKLKTSLRTKNHLGFDSVNLVVVRLLN